MDSYGSKHAGRCYLDKVVEDSEPVWVFALIDLLQGAKLGCFERNVLLTKHNFQLLGPYSVC